MERSIKVNIFLGKNGEGKSFLFEKKIAELYERSNRNILVVCNSIYSRYRKSDLNGYRYFGLVKGRVNIEGIITKFIARSLDDYNYKKIANVLKYLSYEDKIGFNISFNKDYTNDGKPLIEYTDDDRDDPFISSMLDVLKEEKVTKGEKISFGITYKKVEDFLNENEGKIIYFDESVQDEMVATISIFKAIVQNEKKLKRIGLLKHIKYFVTKENSTLPISEMSSGERYLLGLMFFISTFLTNNTSIFIDEPENSLHPKWQLDYIRNIIKFIRYENYYYDHYRNVRINIATHSPLIAQFSCEDKTVIAKKFCVEKGVVRELENQALSVEDIYMDFFNVLTPRNRSLSSHCSDLINDFINNKLSYDEALARVLHYKSISIESNQCDFINEIEKLMKLAKDKKLTS